MADLSMIRAQLGRLRHEVLTCPVFVGGRPNDSQKAAEEAKRLERIAAQLKIILRELQSAEHLLRLRETELPKIPQQHRYSAEQSVKQSAENVKAVSSDAKALAELVRDLLDRNGLLNPFQKAKDFLDLASDLDKLSGHELEHVLIQVQHSKQPVLGPASPGGSPVTVSGVVGLVAFAYVAIKVLQKKFSSKTTSA